MSVNREAPPTPKVADVRVASVQAGGNGQAAKSNGQARLSNGSANVRNYVMVKYFSGWDQAYMHYTVDGDNWTDEPMEKVGDTWHLGRIQLKDCKQKVELVMHNGAGDWDNAPGG